MKVGDLVMCIASGTRNQHRLDEVGLIVDIVTHTETYTSSGCKKYAILTAQGDEHLCWKGELEVINESR
jgi:hypothetical protein